MSCRSWCNKSGHGVSSTTNSSLSVQLVLAPVRFNKRDKWDMCNWQLTPSPYTLSYCALKVVKRQKKKFVRLVLLHCLFFLAVYSVHNILCASDTAFDITDSCCAMVVKCYNNFFHTSCFMCTNRVYFMSFLVDCCALACPLGGSVPYSLTSNSTVKFLWGVSTNLVTTFQVPKL